MNISVPGAAPRADPALREVWMNSITAGSSKPWAYRCYLAEQLKSATVPAPLDRSD